MFWQACAVIELAKSMSGVCRFPNLTVAMHQKGHSHSKRAFLGSQRTGRPIYGKSKLQTSQSAISQTKPNQQEPKLTNPTPVLHWNASIAPWWMTVPQQQNRKPTATEQHKVPTTGKTATSSNKASDGRRCEKATQLSRCCIFPNDLPRSGKAGTTNPSDLRLRRLDYRSS